MDRRSPRARTRTLGALDSVFRLGSLRSVPAPLARAAAVADWALALLLRVGVVIALVLMVLLVVNSWPTESSVDTKQEVGGLVDMPEEELPQGRIINPGCDTDHPVPSVRLTIRQFHVASELISAESTLCLPMSFISTLRTTAGGHSRVAVVTPKRTKIRPRYREAVIRVEADYFILPVFTQRCAAWRSPRKRLQRRDERSASIL
jgi:hypothetical protein